MASAAPDVEPSRQEPRRRVLIRGTLFTPNGASEVWIRDISTRGALVTCKDRLPLDRDVILKRGPFFAAGHIARADETGAALTFYRELRDDEVAAAAMALSSHD